MTNLWQALTLELGSAFKNQYGDAGGTTFLFWASELKDYSEQQLFAGFEKFKALGKTYMSLNIFRNLCRPAPEDYGVLPFEEAFRLANRRDWELLHPAFQVIAQETYERKEKLWPDYQDETRIVQGKTIKSKCRRWDLSLFKDTQDNPKCKTHFRAFYDHVLKRVSDGEQFERIVAVTDQSERPNPSGVKTFGRDRGKKVLGDLLAGMKS